MKFPRMLGGTAAVMAAALALSACGSSGGGSGSTSPTGTTLNWAIASAPRAIDMYGDFSANANVVSSLVNEGLVTLGNLKLKPALATSWKRTSPTTYVYSLREGVTFSDGNPVTAEDVAFSFNRHLAEDSTSQSVSHLKTLKKAKVTGEHEVTVTLTKPDATWVYDPMFAPVVEKSVVEKAGEQYGAPGGTVVGTGPYTVKSFSASDGIVLRRNEHYWGPKPAFEEIHFSYIADPNSLSLALRSGDVDGSFGIALSNVSQFERLKGVTLTEGDALATASLMFDMDTKPFDDIHVRRAFAYAWDAESFTKNVLRGHATPANAISSPGFWANIADPAKVDEVFTSIPAQPFDMAAAARELAQSSVPDGFSTSISYPDSRPELGQALQVLAENLKQLKITLKVTEIPYTQWSTLISEHKDLTIQIAQWNPDYPDPSDLILSQYPSSHAVKNQYNLSNYRSDKVDKLIDEELASTDDAERVQIMTEILQTVAKDVPNVNLYWPKTIMAIRDPYTYQNYNGMYASELWVYNVSAK
ncbi:hypothetical protein FH608_026100 [Nonomuraea phyllanthi]|uniref:Solute-binding protein family 5 domain-containing protein n=1 Tax=Nonomuraea phyllanthi TaxID=2219224 RepID=A0A5C4W6C0_9ACTN|nr:ABC transporter substrate-binding protein [Nonomuraea phyllanthi]KAB8192175.1 hypothetical protein FH608_026100 [Nonomuraea phyllanthi]QFY11472.1 hypothetical protein GBF35_37190 [Nonomuraea phyllanthi]